MSKRVFFAINLPGNIKEELYKISEKWSELPVRWTKKESLHITLCFVGNVEDERLYKLKEGLNTVVPNHRQLPIVLTSITLGPNEFKPRMIWANGEVSPEFHKLVQDMHKHCPDCGCTPEKIKNFKLHITLARIKESSFGRLSKIPPIREELNLAFGVESIELMQSHMLQDGSEYEVLHSVKLQK